MQKQNAQARRLPFSSATKKLLISLLLLAVALDYNIESYGVHLDWIGNILISVFSITVVAGAFAYGLGAKKPNFQKYFNALFWLSVIVFVLCTITFLSAGRLVLDKFSVLAYFVTFFLIFTLLFFLVQLLLYFKDWRLKAALFAAIVIGIIIIFSIQVYSIDDETILAYYAAMHLLGGANPYSSSITGILYSKALNGFGVTVTTGNTIISTFDYPALYLLVGVPFYLIPGQSLNTISASFQEPQFIVYFIILITAYLVLAKRNTDLKANYLGYAAFTFMVLSISSAIVLLMLALVLILYSDIGKRYSWLFLGLAASLQQELWPIVILFLAYSLNNYGLKRGAKELLGVAAVFLIINGYFIASGYSAYVNSVFAPLSSPFPGQYGIIGFIFTAVYPIPLGLFGALFIAAVLISILASLYVNNKKLLLIFSMIPLMLLDHGLLIYYFLPIAAFALLYDIKIKDDGIGALNRMLGRSSACRWIFALLIVALFASMTMVVCLGHQEYIRQFGIGISNQSVLTAGPGRLSYHGLITYNSSYRNSSYLMFMVDNNGTQGYYGFFNSTLIKEQANCSYPCINGNIVGLEGSGAYELNATIPANAFPGAYISAVIYNRDYYYQGPSVVYR